MEADIFISNIRTGREGMGGVGAGRGANGAEVVAVAEAVVGEKEG